jgi:hypothetical protein
MPRLPARRLARLLPSVATVIGGLVSGRADVAAQPAPPAPCDATIVRRETLRDSAGNLLYVSPDVVVARDGELLLAGHSTARFHRKPDGSFDDGVANAFAVAVRSASGVVRTVAAPEVLAKATLRDLRAVALPNGRWGVLFLDYPESSVRNAPPPVASLWFGVLGASGWESVERVPVPDGVRLLTPVARPMQVAGDRVLAAVPARDASGESGVLLAERVGRRWRARHHAVRGLGYAGIAMSGASRTPTVVAVRPDDVVQGFSTNEVFLYHPARRTDSLVKVPVERTAPAHDPIMHATTRGLSVAWLADVPVGGETRRVPYHSFVRDGVPEMARPLGDEATRLITVPNGGDGVIAVTARSSAMDTIQVDIQHLPLSSRGVRLTHAARFAEVIGAARWNESELVVTLLNATMVGTITLSSEVFWIKAQCSPNPEGRRVP